MNDHESRVYARQERQHVQQLARTHTVSALNTLVRIMNSPAAKHSDRILCAKYILDRAYGRPAQALIINDPAGDSAFNETQELLQRLSDKDLVQLQALYDKMAVPPTEG